MVKRGEVYLADLSPVVGSEQGGKRPVLIVQNDVGNHFSTTVIVAAITAKHKKRIYQRILKFKKINFNLVRNLLYY